MSRKALMIAVALVLLIGGAVALIHILGQPAAPDPTPAPATEAPAPTPSPEPTASPAPTAAPETATPAPQADPGADNDNRAADPQGGETGEAVAYAKGYVRVLSPTTSGWLPLPEEEPYVFPLRQMKADGTVTINSICVTPEGVYMESATCDNQDCVHQGLVTLENMDGRALGNMIICLPNQVYLELYSTEELLGAAAEETDGAAD